MKKALMALAAVAMGASAFAQGTIIFSNRNVPTDNGSATYNIPIWTVSGSPDGAGDLPGGVTVGLFRDAAATTPLGVTILRTDANSQFFGTPSSQTVTVTGAEAGTTPTLVVRAWQGASFAAAQAGAGQWGQWSFTTKPLGGTPPGGGLPITSPNMTGWGPETGAGLNLVPEPSTIALGVLGVGALLLRRRK